MMTAVFWLITTLFLLPAAQPAPVLTVQILGVQKNKGYLMAEVKNDAGKVVKQVKHNVATGGTEIVLRDLPAASYAIAVFHDANADGKLNTNLVGMPTEAYGFSNDARGVFGPPGLAEQLFLFPKDARITITIK